MVGRLPDEKTPQSYRYLNTQASRLMRIAQGIEMSNPQDERVQANRALAENINALLKGWETV